MKALSGKKILITSGPTFAPLDAVRCITNRSTGRLGSTIARYLHHAGAEVIFLAGETSITPSGLFPGEEFSRMTIHNFFTVDDLKNLLYYHLSHESIDAVLMAAAVLDYLPVAAETGKKSSKEEEWIVRFRKGEKLIEKIQEWAPLTSIIGFKLETGISKEELGERAGDLIRRSGAKMVVANLLENIDDTQHTAYFIRPAGERYQISEPMLTREEIGEKMVDFLFLSEP